VDQEESDGKRTLLDSLVKIHAKDLTMVQKPLSRIIKLQEDRASEDFAQLDRVLALLKTGLVCR
jgi:hypothetical protein